MIGETKATRGYWYIHTNGNRIFQPAIVAESGTTPTEYFDSPFVKEWWAGYSDDSRTPEEKK